MICVHMWSVSAVSFHSAKGRAGQNSSRLSLAIFTWNELLLAALDLPRDTSQIQATHLNANIESRGAFAYFAHASFCHICNKSSSSRSDLISLVQALRSRAPSHARWCRFGAQRGKGYYSRLMKSENERFTLSNMPRASSWVRWKACEIRDLTLPIIPPSSSLS